MKSISVKHYTLISFTLLIKLKLVKKKSNRNVHLFKQMLTFMHVTCEFQLWDIFVVADLYTSNYSFKMAKIGSYEYFLVIFAFAQCENNYESPKRILISNEEKTIKVI